MIEKQSEPKNREEKKNPQGTASKLVDAALFTAAGAALGGAVVDNMRKGPSPEVPEMHERTTIDHQASEQRAATLIFMLDGIYRTGEKTVYEDAERLLMQYLQGGDFSEIQRGVHRYGSPDVERRQAVARLGEAINGLAFWTTADCVVWLERIRGC